MLGIAEQRPLRQYQIVKRLLRCSSKFGEVPGGGYRAVGESRRRGSFFIPESIKKKGERTIPTTAPLLFFARVVIGRNSLMRAIAVVAKRLVAVVAKCAETFREA